MKETRCVSCGFTGIRLQGEDACPLCGFSSKPSNSADQVNHPAHYTSSPARCSRCGKGIECIDVVEHLGFSLGNAIKYLWRADLKGDAIENLEKAVWYIHREIDKRMRANPTGCESVRKPVSWSDIVEGETQLRERHK